MSGQHVNPALQNNKLPFIFFDGYCNLCSGIVQFVIRHGGKRKFNIVPLQHAENLSHLILPQKIQPGSVVLFYKGKLLYKSNAVIRICILLGFPWSLAGVGLIIPRFLRDALYNYVSSNRIKWFGERKTCYLPEEGDNGH
ncbi:MAG TPA: DCC1-like thiol-disulfide oxidoreductase family protein [Bacteroidia bacterium]|nr:DCC1-like thiol-disulfide oxidoreductase family protein [Bacteroidia bacterium]